jgi:hypothetical protein
MAFAGDWRICRPAGAGDAEADGYQRRPGMSNPALSHNEYEKNLEWAAKSYREAFAGEPVTCRGCDRKFELIKLFRCFHCGSYFCPHCARAHFGPRGGGRFKVKEAS